MKKWRWFAKSGHTVADHFGTKKWMAPFLLMALREVWPDVGMKSSQIVSKSCQKVAKAIFTQKDICLTVAQTFKKCLDYFCHINFCHEFSKIAQSGHTDCVTRQKKRKD